jgi:glucosamine-6-phosphate deaminase
VPTHAITATIPTLLGASRVVAVVPEARKAEPVAAALTGPVTTGCPASVLRTRGSVRLYLDEESAAGLAR